MKLPEVQIVPTENSLGYVIRFYKDKPSLGYYQTAVISEEELAELFMVINDHFDR